jgi:hypothetical protein
MSLQTLINANVKDPTCKVFFNGRRARDILRIETSSSINDQLSSATIETLSISNIKPEDRIQIQQGYNAQERLTFTGIVDTITYNEFAKTYIIEARDVLKKALDTFLVQEVAFGVDNATGHYFYSTYTAFDGGTFHIHEYTNSADLYSNHPETVGNITSQGAKAEAVVQWLLHMSGLAEGSEIQVDDTNFFIGDLTPARFHMESVYDSAQRIAQLIGWRIYADPAGVARFRRRPRAPGGYTSWNYSTKGSTKNIRSISRSDTNMDLRTYVEVRGASGISYTARGTSPYLGTTAYRGVLISSELIDTPGIAAFMGDRVLSDLNRLKTTVELESDGNPILTPASTVFVSSNVATGNFLVEELQSTMTADAGYTTQLKCTAYPGDTDLESPPTTSGVVAVFSPIQVVSFGDPKLMVTFDGSASYSNEGVITTWKWDWPDATSYTAGDPIGMYAFDQASISNGLFQNVSLTVTDDLGNTGTTTSGITFEGLTENLRVLYRQLYGALTTQAVGSLDGGNVWNVKTLDAISVAASNFAAGGVFVTSGYALFGTSSDTGIWRTEDCCVTVSKVFSTTNDPVTAVHIAELDGRYALAGTQSGKVYVSRDSGNTWSIATSIPTSIREIKHAYTNYDYILSVGSGLSNVYESFDRGIHWAKLPVTAAYDVNRESSGMSSNYFAHQTGVLGVNAGVGTPLTFSGGGSVAVPALTVAINDNAGVMIVDATGQHWNAASGQFNPTQFNGNNKTRHMLRDGEVLNVVYYANASGIGKSLNGNHTMQALYSAIGSVPPSGWGREVAYGPLAPLASPARIILRGDINTAQGWYVASGVGWSLITSDGTPLSGPANTTPGYVVWGTTDDVHMLKITASGILPMINHHTIVPSTNGSDLAGVYFSRKIFPSGVLPTVYLSVGTGTDAAGVSRGILDLHRFEDFYDDPSTYDVLEGTASSVFESAHQRRMAYNKDMFHSAIVAGLFAPNTDYYVYDADLWEIRTASKDKTNLLFYHSVFSVDYWALYHAYNTTDAYLLQDATTTRITNLDDVALGFVFESAIRRGSLYVGVPDGTALSPGVYLMEGNGRGRAEVLLEAPVGYADLHSFIVTHDVVESQDYLVAVFKKDDNSSAVLYYSLDGGTTWDQGPPILYNTGGNNQLLEAYYVDSRES